MLKRFLDYLVRADISVTSKKGEVGMKRLLEDAAYLSPVWVERTKKANPEKQEPEESFQARSGAMWEFCADVGHVGTRFRRASEITKHAATKPISQALDQLMLGRGSEAALGKFIQNLSTAEYIDSKEVSAFVKGVKSIIEEAEKLRQKNVTDFLRYKNGLLSAVFMFTRYPDLKSVLVAK